MPFGAETTPSPAIYGKMMRFIPKVTEGGIVWDCTSSAFGGPMPNKYRPVNCRP